MRKGLTILLAAVLLSPALAGFGVSAPVESCECEPVSCQCSAHDHSSAHAPLCAFANGGKCGVKSSDLAAASLISHPVILASMATDPPPLVPERFEGVPVPARETSLEPKPPTPPPRFAA